MKSLLLMFVLAMIMAMPQITPASSLAEQNSIEDQGIIIYPGYPGYPGYPYPGVYHPHPYVAPHGEWKNVATFTFEVEDQIDALKNIADDVADKSKDPVDRKIEKQAKKLDSAIDNLLGEIVNYGIYSVSDIERFYENVNVQSVELQKMLVAKPGGQVSKSFETTTAMLVKLQTAYKKANP